MCDPATGYPRRTAFLVLDADDSSCGANREITDSEWLNLSVPNLNQILAATNRTQLPGYEREWLSPDISAVAIATGAGGVRQIGRLQLFRHVRQFEQMFTNALNENIRVIKNNPNIRQKIDVLIFAGLAGGTGSGTFLDVAYLVKHWINRICGANTYDVRVFGYFTLPNLYFSRSGIQGDEGKQALMKANAYAALKELDYWMNTNGKTTRMSISQVYAQGNTPIDVKWDDEPFMLTFLMSDRRESGTPIKDAYEHVIDSIAEMMLYCYADETQTQAGNAQFTFDSFMSNVFQSLLTIRQGGGNQLPVSCSFASLGVSSTKSVEKLISNYQVTQVVGKMNAETLVDSNGTVVTPAQLAQGIDGNLYFDYEDNVGELYRALFGNTLVIHPNESLMNDIKALVENEESAFKSKNPYIEGVYSADEIANATEALFQADIQNNAGENNNTPNSWRKQAYRDTNELLKNEMTQFKALCEEMITKPVIGPKQWKKFLDASLIPCLNELIKIWDGKASSGYQNYTNGCSRAAQLSESIRKYSPVRRTVYFLHPNQEIETYKQHEQDAAMGLRQSVYAASRRDSLKNLKEYVERYHDMLSVLLRLVDELAEESEEELERTNGAGATFLITREQLENYCNQQNGIELEMASARDQMYKMLAGCCAELCDTPVNDDTHRAQEESKLQIRRGMLSFIENTLKPSLGMNNMNWMIQALTPQQTRQEQINYVQTELCSTLDQAAEPMLPEKKNGYLPNPMEFRYLSVPSDADLIVAGFQAYCGTANQDQVKTSAMTDRVLWLKVRVGIDASTVEPDIRDLQTAYELQMAATNPTLSAGIHLMHATRATSFNEGNWSAEQCWALLPNLIPNPLSLSEQLTAREEKNWIEVRRIFEIANNLGMVHKLDNGFFSVDLLRSSRNADDFDGELKKIRKTVEQDALSVNEHIAMIRQELQEWMETSEPMEYLRFRDRVLGLLGLDPLPPNPTNAAREKHEAEANETEKKLLAYLVMLRPNYLKRLQGQLNMMEKCDKLLKELEKQKAQEENFERQCRSYARLIVSGILQGDKQGAYLWDFVAEKEIPLFDFDMERLQIQNLPFQVCNGVRQYWEGCFLLQYILYNQPLPTNVQARLDHELKRCSCGLREFGSNEPELCEKYKNNIARSIDKYTRYVGNRQLMSEIDENKEFAYGETRNLRRLLKLAYQAILSELQIDNGILN